MITEVNEENGFVVVDQSPTRRDDARVRRHGGGRTRCPGDSGMRRQGI